MTHHIPSFRYGILGFQFTDTPSINKEACTAVLTSIGLAGWKVGKTKVFLKYFHADALGQRVEFMSKMALRIQTWLRMVVKRREYKRLLALAQVEQNAALIFMGDIRAIGEQNVRWQVQQNDEDERRHVAKHGVDADALMATAGVGAGPVPDPGGGGTIPPPPPPPPEWAKIGTKAHRKQSVKLGKQQEKWVESQKQLGTILEAPSSDTAGNAALPWKESKQELAAWFRGVGYTRLNAETELAGRLIGTYMIRVSESRCGYTLTTLQESAVRHYPIDETDDRSFKLKGSTDMVFDSLPNLISHYTGASISSKYPKEMLTEPIGEVPPPPDDDDDDDTVEYADVDFSNFNSNVADALQNDTVGAINSEAIGNMERRFGVRQTSNLPEPIHMRSSMVNSPEGFAMVDDAGHDYTKFVRRGSNVEREDMAQPAVPPRGPNKKDRSPSEKKAFVAMMAAAEERIAVARRENQMKKAKIEKLKKGGKKKKKEWAKKQKPGFNLVPAHIRSGPEFVNLRARQGKHKAKEPGHRPARPQSVDYRELGALQKETFGF